MNCKLCKHIWKYLRQIKKHYCSNRPLVVMITIWCLCLSGAYYQISASLDRYLHSSKTYINMDYPTIFRIPDMSICIDFVHLINASLLIQHDLFIRDLIDMIRVEANTIDPPNESTTSSSANTQTNDGQWAFSQQEVIPSFVNITDVSVDELEQWLHNSSFHTLIYALLDQHFDTFQIYTLLRPAEQFIADMRVPSNQRPGYLSRKELNETYKRHDNFKGKQICYTFSAQRPYRLYRINLLQIRSRGVIFEIQLNAHALRKVPYFSVYLHEQGGLPRNYQSSLFEVLETRYPAACFYGLTYNRYVNRLQFDCRAYSQYHPDLMENHLQTDQLLHLISTSGSNPFRSQAEAVEHCVNEHTYQRYQSAFWNNIYSPVWKERVRIGFVSQVLDFDEEQDVLADTVDECERLHWEPECEQQMFVPVLKKVLSIDSQYSHVILNAPLEPEIAIRVGRYMSVFELFIHVCSVLTCWLAFTMVTFLHTLLKPLTCFRLRF